MFLIPNKCIVSIMYIYLMHISYMFQCFCTIIRENNYATYASTVMTLLSTGSIL
jgi:hypothetical protein